MAVVLFLAISQMELSAQNEPVTPPKPAVRISLSTMGYNEPSRADRLSNDTWSETLQFLDDRHVLLTFELKGLFRRLPSCPPEHRDRLVHAVILDLDTKTVVKETDWYLHDRERYLWSLAPGEVLLRKLNDLYVVDASLHEKLLWSSPQKLLWVSVTPDGSQIIVETVDHTSTDAASAAESTPPISPAKPGISTAPEEPKYVARFLNAQTLQPMHTVPLKKLVQVTGTRWGYADLIDNDHVWLIRFGPTPLQRTNITRIRSAMMPYILYSGTNSLVVGGCSGPTCQYPVSSFSLTGRRLWRQHWPEYRWYPTTSYSADNSRFAVGAIGIDHKPIPSQKATVNQQNDPYQTDSSELDVFRQQALVLDTPTGAVLEKVDVEPAVISGQNLSLSPDGNTLAVLNHESLDLFSLPPPSAEQKAEFAKLKDDVPALFDMALSSEPVAATSDLTRPASFNLNAPSTNHAVSGTTASSTTPLPPAPADETAGSRDTSTTFKVTTRAVVVDVLVTDSKGHPIHGLAEKDFHVTEDAAPQEIRSFREIVGPSAPSGNKNSVPDSPKAMASDAQEHVKNSEPDPPANTSSEAGKENGAVTLILFDALNTLPQDQVFAREQLVKFLSSMPPHLQIGLCTLSAAGSHLRMVQGFTSDQRLLMAAATGNKVKQAVANYQGSQTSTATDIDNLSLLANDSISNGFQGLLSALQRMQSEEQSINTDQRVAITVNSLMMLSRYLAAIPGRKNVVWLSGSFPVAIPSTYAADEPSLSNRDYSGAIKAMTNLLAQAQIAVYPVDAHGNRGFNSFSAENASGINTAGYQGPQDINGTSVSTPQSEVPGDQEFADMVAERASLSQVAQATGGKAFFNTNAIGQAIATAVEEGSNYYVLSYTPTDDKYDGKFRKIKVALEQKGYKLHYRPGYFAVSSTTDEVESARFARVVAMQHSSPVSRQLLFSVNVVPVGKPDKMEREKLGPVLLAPNKMPILPLRPEVQHYSVDYTFKTQDLSFTSSANTTFRNSLILMVGSYNNEGRMISASSALAVTELKKPDYQKIADDEVTIHQEIDVPTNALWLRLGIQDQNSNKLGTVEFMMPIPLPPGQPRRATKKLPDIEPD